MDQQTDPPWFPEWAIAHMARFPGLDWGSDPGELFEGFRQAFLRHHVTRGEADSASYRAMEARIYPDAMLHHLLTSIREVRSGIVAAGAPQQSTPWCGLCGGDGWASLPPDDRHTSGSAIPCGCAVGVDIATRMRAVGRHIECLAERPDLREWIARDHREREERGAAQIAAVGADPYGTVEEIARGVAILARGMTFRAPEPAHGPQEIAPAFR